MYEQIARLQALESFIRDRIAPTVTSHGGHVEIERFEAGVVEIRLSGACSSCSLDVLSADRITEYLFEHFPDLEDVVVRSDVEWIDDLPPLTPGSDP